MTKYKPNFKILETIIESDDESLTDTDDCDETETVIERGMTPITPLTNATNPYSPEYDSLELDDDSDDDIMGLTILDNMQSY